MINETRAVLHHAVQIIYYIIKVKYNITKKRKS